MLADFSTLVAAGQVRIAWRAGRFAGYVVVEPRQDELHLDGIAILPELAGSGLGRRLVSAVEEEAGRLGLAKVTLYTNASMFENLTLYPHLGYHETDRRRENGFDRVYFEKILS